MAINAKRPAQVRFLLSRAGTLVQSIPASEIAEERRQLSDLRKKFAATTKAKPATAKKPAPQPTRLPDLGDRCINRAALGYAPTDKP